MPICALCAREQGKSAGSGENEGLCVCRARLFVACIAYTKHIMTMPS